MAKKKKKSFLSEMRSLSQAKSSRTMMSRSKEIWRMPDEPDNEGLSEDKEAWVQEQLAKNMTLDEFNQEFESWGYSLTVGEGKLSEYDENGNCQEHEGSLLELNLEGKGIPEIVTKFDTKEPMIPYEIFADMTWQW